MFKQKTQLNYGTVAGLVGFIFFLIYYITNSDPFGTVSWISFWIPGLFMFLATKKYRDTIQEGYISYWQAFASCFIVCFIQASLFNMLAYLFGVLINHSFVQLYINESLKGLDQARKFISEDKMAAIIDKIKHVTLAQLVVGDFWNKLVGGIIVALILAGVLRKKKPLFEEAEVVENNPGEIEE